MQASHLESILAANNKRRTPLTRARSVKKEAVDIEMVNDEEEEKVSAPKQMG